MSVATGLAVLFAATTVFLALALSGALLQRAALLRRLEHLSRESDLPETLWGRSILLISKNCPACAAALTEVRTSNPDPSLLILASSDEAYGADVHVDADSWMALFPGYTPCLVTVDARGHVRASEPVGSSAALQHQLRSLSSS